MFYDNKIIKNIIGHKRIKINLTSLVKNIQVKNQLNNFKCVRAYTHKVRDNTQYYILYKKKTFRTSYFHRHTRIHIVYIII